MSNLRSLLSWRASWRPLVSANWFSHDVNHVSLYIDETHKFKWFLVKYFQTHSAYFALTTMYFLMLPIYGYLVYLCFLYYRYDLPGKDILYRGWSVVGPSVPARHVPGGGIFQSRLLSVPQHFWSPNSSLQCERTRGEILVDITKPTAGCSHPLLPSAGQQ